MCDAGAVNSATPAVGKVDFSGLTKFSYKGTRHFLVPIFNSLSSHEGKELSPSYCEFHTHEYMAQMRARESS